MPDERATRAGALTSRARAGHAPSDTESATDPTTHIKTKEIYRQECDAFRRVGQREGLSGVDQRDLQHRLADEFRRSSDGVWRVEESLPSHRQAEAPVPDQHGCAGLGLCILYPLNRGSVASHHLLVCVVRSACAADDFDGAERRDRRDGLSLPPMRVLVPGIFGSVVALAQLGHILLCDAVPVVLHCRCVRPNEGEERRRGCMVP